MTRYLSRRVLQALLVVWAAFTLTWIILYAMPSDPAAIIAAGDLSNASGGGSAEQLAAIRADLGLDRPALVQYADSLWGMVSGDWGTSYQTGQGVATMVVEALRPTLEVAALGLLLAVVIGMPLGFFATYSTHGFLRQMLMSMPSVGASIPPFWSALLLIQVFSFGLGWFPAFGSGSFDTMVLPALALAVPVSAIIAQIFGKSMREAMAEPYLETARAKGHSRIGAMTAHAVKNALLPVLTTIGTIVGLLLSGTVVIETVFSRNGLGRLTIDAVNQQDIPVVMGVVVFSAIVFVVVTLLVDLIYPLIDPRVRPAVAAKSKG